MLKVTQPCGHQICILSCRHWNYLGAFRHHFVLDPYPRIQVRGLGVGPLASHGDQLHMQIWHLLISSSLVADWVLLLCRWGSPVWLTHLS